MLARWGVDDHQHILGKILARLAERNDLQGGREPWLGLRWYPLTLLLYSGGIAALAANNFRSFSTLLTTQIGMRNTGGETQAVIIPAVKGMLDVKRTKAFKRLPGYERFYIPESEYLFKALQPRLDDLLFLGNTYESLFDDFEIFLALVFADLTTDGPGHLWGPPGRFGWKHRHRLSESPFEGLVSKAERENENWPPLRCGLFGGSGERFREIAGRYREELLNSLPSY